MTRPRAYFSTFTRVSHRSTWICTRRADGKIIGSWNLWARMPARSRKYSTQPSRRGRTKRWRATTSTTPPWARSTCTQWATSAKCRCWCAVRIWTRSGSRIGARILARRTSLTMISRILFTFQRIFPSRRTTRTRYTSRRHRSQWTIACHACSSYVSATGPASTASDWTGHSTRRIITKTKCSSSKASRSSCSPSRKCSVRHSTQI